MAHNIKSIRKQFKDAGVFYTDSKLAELLKSFIPDDITEVYDPTCGDGALLSVFDDVVHKYGQEIDESQLNEASKRLVNFTGYAGDTLKSPALLDKKFDAIVANPPFSIKWEPVQDDVRFKDAPTVPTSSKADYAFLLHILYMLSDTGVAAVLNFPGILYRGNREGEIRKWMVQKNYIDKVIHIEGGYFVDTTIPTALLIIRKNKETKDIEFIDHEKNESRIVGIEEIEGNDYNLSVSSYIQDEIEEIERDPIEMEVNARKQALNRIRSEIEFSIAVCEMENIRIEPFLDDIINIARSYKKKKERAKDNTQGKLWE